MIPEKFKALPKAKRRILIAKDVLLRIKLKQFLPAFGYKSFTTKVKNIVDVRDGILQNNVVCQGCAKGGVFFSAIAMKDSMSLIQARTQDINSNNDFLLEEFTQKQLDMIECAYETYAVRYLVASTEERCSRFGERYYDRDERLEAIMKNIVKNEGTFKP